MVVTVGAVMVVDSSAMVLGSSGVVLRLIYCSSNAFLA